MAALLLAAAALFSALGVWQVERRAWKLALITATDQRVHAPPQPAPAPPAWPGLSTQSALYTPVQVHGALLNQKETLVQAVTERGPGFWVLTPLQTDEGWTVLVNRGFVPPEHSAPESHATPPLATITGLLRITEPGGAFLSTNDPTANRWFSRDVAAISQARGLQNAAPYFIDADSTPNPGGYPIGGLTVIAFPNNHLLYAITWFSLAALSPIGLWMMRHLDRQRTR